MDSTKEPLLFYPILTGTENMTFHDLKPRCVLDGEFFAQTVIVEIPKKSVANDRVWKKLHQLGIEEDEMIVMIKEQARKRLDLPKTSKMLNIKMYPDSHYVRVTVWFRTPEEARDASHRYHRSEEYPNVCAHVVDDIITTMRQLEFHVTQSQVNKKQSQLVYLSMPTFTNEDVIVVFCRLTYISTTKISVEANGARDGVTEVMLRYPYLSDAFVAEMLLDGTTVSNKLFHARLQRNPVLVQHDLNVRVSLMGNPAEIPLAGENLVSESEINTLPVVGCSYFDCISCGNARLKLPSGPQTASTNESHELHTDTTSHPPGTVA